jgi:hypothetical protein
VNAVSDPRGFDLYVSAQTFLAQHDLHPDPDTYLAHGYVPLCLKAWPATAGAPLRLATQWALWTWRADDVFDTELCDATPDAVSVLIVRLIGVADGVDRPWPGDHPLVAALGQLVAETRAMMPGIWWARYRDQLESWIHAATEKLLTYVQPGRTPTLREYLALRPADGGMVLAAMWTELAHQCLTADWSTPPVQSLLRCFSTCGILANDLAADAGDTFTAVTALVRTAGMPVAEARERVRELLRAEEHRFWWLYTAVREMPDELQPQASRSGPVLDTSRFALHLDRFRRALTEWTAGSSRYALAAPAEPAR